MHLKTIGNDKSCKVIVSAWLNHVATFRFTILWYLRMEFIIHFRKVDIVKLLNMRSLILTGQICRVE